MSQSKRLTHLRGVRQPRRTSESGISRNRWIVLLGLACFLLNACGCAKLHGLSPITPSLGDPASPITVRTLQPVLEWEPSEGPEVTL